MSIVKALSVERSDNRAPLHVHPVQNRSTSFALWLHWENPTITPLIPIVDILIFRLLVSNNALATQKKSAGQGWNKL